MLANAACDVLHGQCLRSNAGLFYSEVPGVLRDAADDRRQRRAWQRRSARNGRAVLPAALQLAGDRAQVHRHAAIGCGASRRRNVMEPMPGWLARRRRVLEPARMSSHALPKGAATDIAATAPARIGEAAAIHRSPAGESAAVAASAPTVRPEPPARTAAPSCAKTQRRSIPARTGDRLRDGQTGAAATTAARVEATAAVGPASRRPAAGAGRRRRRAAGSAHRHPNDSHLPSALRRRQRRVARAGGQAAPARPTPPQRRAVAMPAVHQVLATLGYGDAIGNEVLGIQRVLRAAGYESEIFVETADSRLEDLTLDYRDLPDASHPDNILLHHFSLGSRASRLAYALPDRMALDLPQHHAAGVLRRRHRELVQLCFLGRRELGALRDPLRAGARRLRIQPPGARGARLSARPACCRWCPDFSHLCGPANYMQAGVFDDDWVNVLFVGRDDPEQADRGRDPLLPRLQDAGSIRDRGCCWSARMPASSATWRCCTNLIARLGVPRRALPRPRQRTRSWPRTTSSPTSSCARASTKASACRWSSRSTWACRCWPMPPPRCRRRWTAPACSIRTRIRCTSPALINAVVDDRDLRGSHRRRPGRGARSARSEGFRRHAARVSSTACWRAPRRAHPPVAFDFWDQVDAGRGARRDPSRTGRRRSRRCPKPEPRVRRRDPTDRQPMIVNQWVPAAHKGDAIGDSARRVRGLLREMGHQSDLYAMTIDDDLRGDVRPWTDPRRDARRPDDLPFRAGVADDRGVRAAASRPRAAVSQRHAGAFLRRLRRRRSSGWRCSAART